MALPQRRAAVVELRRITSDAEYQAALARIAELADADDLESAGEMDALANYVEAWEEAQRSRVRLSLHG
jgi:antitoxin component HigA of HigAB toxin-antitoxin module